MQRFCTKLRFFAVQSNRNLSPIPASRRLLHHSPSLYHQQTLGSAPSKWSFLPVARGGLPSGCRVSSVATGSVGSSLLPHHFVQVRNITSKERKAKWKKKWRPRTPITSKVKKIKIKAYSSYKDRFRTLSDGTIRRWKEGKRHNAHLKSKKSKRRLRQPAIVPAAYAKVMKKLNFCG